MLVAQRDKSLAYYVECMNRVVSNAQQVSLYDILELRYNASGKSQLTTSKRVGERVDVEINVEAVSTHFKKVCEDYADSIAVLYAAKVLQISDSEVRETCVLDGSFNLDYISTYLLTILTDMDESIKDLSQDSTFQPPVEEYSDYSAVFQRQLEIYELMKEEYVNPKVVDFNIFYDKENPENFKILQELDRELDNRKVAILQKAQEYDSMIQGLSLLHLEERE